MLKAIPRQSVELSVQEALSLIPALFKNPGASGKLVREFERRIAELIGVKEAISFSSQRAGMYAVLKSLEPQPGDEVIVPAYTFFSIPACAVLAGFKPIFADVDPSTWNLDPEKVKQAITERSRAIIVSHLNGCPADLSELHQIAKQKNLVLIEDCAQAFGAKFGNKFLGSFGVGCFSFGEGKNLYAMGGGLITTQDSRLASRLREIAEQASSIRFSEVLSKITRSVAFSILSRPFIFTFTSFPFFYLASLSNRNVDTDLEHRLQDMPQTSFSYSFSNGQAALGLGQLERLEERSQRRMDNARWLTEGLEKVEGLVLPPEPKDRTHLFLHYAVRVQDRERLVRQLIRRGVDAQRDYCSSFPLLPDFPGDSSSSPIAKGLAGNVVYLPNQPSLKKQDMLRIAKEIRNYFLTL